MHLKSTGVPARGPCFLAFSMARRERSIPHTEWARVARKHGVFAGSAANIQNGALDPALVLELDDDRLGMADVPGGSSLVQGVEVDIHTLLIAIGP